MSQTVVECVELQAATALVEGTSYDRKGTVVVIYRYICLGIAAVRCERCIPL